MEGNTKFFLTEEEKRQFIDAMTPELTTLRTKAGITQDEISKLIGTSRQTYGSIERGTRIMSWGTFLSLTIFYYFNRKTHNFIKNSSAFPSNLIKRFNDGEESVNFELGLFFPPEKQDILSQLDEQAISTIKTVIMLEYLRCNNVSSTDVIKLFEGVNILKSVSSESIQKNIEITKALNNIKTK